MQVPPARRQELGQHAQPAADLEHHVAAVQLGGVTDHPQDVVVDQEVLAELPVRAYAEGAQPPQAGLARLTPARLVLRRAHAPNTRSRFASTVRSRSS